MMKKINLTSEKKPQQDNLSFVEKMEDKKPHRSRLKLCVVLQRYAFDNLIFNHHILITTTHILITIKDGLWYLEPKFITTTDDTLIFKHHHLITSNDNFTCHHLTQKPWPKLVMKTFLKRIVNIKTKQISTYIIHASTKIHGDQVFVYEKSKI